MYINICASDLTAVIIRDSSLFLSSFLFDSDDKAVQKAYQLLGIVKRTLIF